MDSQSSRQVSELALELSLELETSLTLTCLSDARLGALKGYLNEKSVSVCVCVVSGLQFLFQICLDRFNEN